MKNNDFNPCNKLTGITIWILQVTLGISFMLHGTGKLPFPPEKFISWLDSIGVIAPYFIGSLVTIGEIAAGAGLIIGSVIPGVIGNYLTKLSALSVFIIMIGAFYLAHSDWFINEKLFKSEQIYIFVLSIFFLINGNKK
tara:strand:+ start:818 stop:1234 length:417 start_codon:yes stop_codon:yes gene_type:complete